MTVGAIEGGGVTEWTGPSDSAEDLAELSASSLRLSRIRLSNLAKCSPRKVMFASMPCNGLRISSAIT